MGQEVIARILLIERQASKLRDDAVGQAAAIVSQAEAAAAATHDQVLAEARREAVQIGSAGREAAEAERTQIVAKAEEEARGLEAVALQHIDEAVAYVIRQVAGSD
jgi:vacuolar-type H+-ATPase subunit H